MESGTKLGHSEISTLLGKSGMGEVWRARDTNGNGMVEESETPADLRRFAGSSQSQFEGFDASDDGMLSGAEVVRGPINFVRPSDITYTDEFRIFSSLRTRSCRCAIDRV